MNGAKDAQLAHAEQLFEKILEQEGTRLPSARRFAARQRTPEEGIHIPRLLYETIREFNKD
jgi:LDH2 family malate/lactate/ureidoglycolate dehydrogenase